MGEIDRDQEVAILILNGITGIVYDRYSALRQFFGENPHCCRHAGFAGIFRINDIEAALPQDICDGPRVACGISNRGFSVGLIANDKSNARLVRRERYASAR